MTVDITTVVADLQKALTDAQAVAAANPALLPGCTFYTDFTDPVQFNAAHIHANGMTPSLLARVVQVPGGGCQINWPAGTADGSPAWVTTLNPAWTTQSQGIGTTPYWFQFEYQVPASRLARSVDGGGGFKMFILGGYIPGANWSSSSSDINNEFVVTNSLYRGFPIAYVHAMDSVGGWNGAYEMFETPYASPYNASDFKLQNAIDRVGAVDQAHQYCLYSQSKGASPPNPLNPGAFAYVPDERLLVKCRVHYGTYGVGSGAGNEIDVWCKRPGDAAWTNVVSARGFPVPVDPAYPGGPNGLWLTSYDTGGGVYTADTYARYYNLWIGTQDPSPTGTVLPPLAVPVPTPAPTSSTFYAAVPSGSIVNASVNNAYDVDPCAKHSGCAWSGNGGQPEMLNDTGMVYIKEMGAQGSLVWKGGGHSNYFGNEVYCYDVDTRTYSRLTDPCPNLYMDPAAVAAQKAGTLTSAESWRMFFEDTWWGELWADNVWPPLGTGDGSPAPIGNKATLQDQPADSHMYGYQVALPPGFGHSDPQGALLTTALPSLSPNGQGIGKGSHILPMTPGADGKRHWSRFSPQLTTESAAFTGAFLDTKRRIVLSHGYRSNFDAMNVDTKARVLCKVTRPVGQATSNLYGTWMYDAIRDLYVYFRGAMSSSPPMLLVVDPVTFVESNVPLSGVLPLATASYYDSNNVLINGYTHGGSTWVPALGGLVYYAGDAGKTAYSVIPSGDPKTAPWTITPMTFTGQQPIVQFSPFQSFHMARFNYVESLDGFFWTALTNVPIQFWKR